MSKLERRKAITVYSANSTKSTNTLNGRNTDFLIVKADGDIRTIGASDGSKPGKHLS
jgi:hypothetical protein